MQKQFLQIDRLDHVVVDAHTKAPLFGGKVVPGGHEQDGDVFVRSPDRTGKLKAVHLRHHNVRDDEIEHSPAVHGIIGLVGAEAAQRVISVLIQKRAHSPIQFPIILNYQKFEHGCILRKL